MAAGRPRAATQLLSGARHAAPDALRSTSFPSVKPRSSLRDQIGIRQTGPLKQALSILGSYRLLKSHSPRNQAGQGVTSWNASSSCTIVPGVRRAEEATVKRRERYSMQVTCPRCGKSGRVVWAESQPTRSRASLAYAPKLVFSGFHTGPGTNKTGNPTVYCVGCDAPTGLFGATGQRCQILQGARQLAFA